MKYVAYSLPTMLASVALLSSVGACGKLPGFAVNAKVDDFQQEAIVNDKIDILFVIDNSGSMDAEQAKVAESFTDFINQFGSRKLNFQVGVISTDVTTTANYWTNVNGPYKKFANNGPGTLLAYKSGGVTNDKIITSNTPNYTQQFQQNVTLGITASGAEAGLFSTLYAFAPDKLAVGGWNEGFVRPEALLSIIFLSDEDESRGQGTNSNHYVKAVPADRATRVAQFSSLVSSLKPDKPDLLRVDAIVARTQAECPTVGTDGAGRLGTGDVYMEVAAAFNGKSHNICQNFATDLLEIGGDLLTLLTRFKLVQKPDGQIEVRVNDVLVPRDETNGWAYLPETNEVEFRGDAVPAADAKIAVTYVPGEPLR